MSSNSMRKPETQEFHSSITFKYVYIFFRASLNLCAEINARFHFIFIIVYFRLFSHDYSLHHLNVTSISFHRLDFEKCTILLRIIIVKLLCFFALIEYVERAWYLWSEYWYVRKQSLQEVIYLYSVVNSLHLDSAKVGQCRLYWWKFPFLLTSLTNRVGACNVM